MQQAVTYAASQNARFKGNSANLVDLVTRLNDTVAAQPPKSQKNWHSGLKAALAKFRKNNPGITTLNLAPRKINREQFALCQAIDLALEYLTIDTTMQRLPDLKWLLHIISNFKAHQAQPIQVYPVNESHMGAWDGQHTALALYLIAVNGLGMKMEDVVVPCNIYSMGSRGLIRNTFIQNNSYAGKMQGKKSLDMIDIVEQMIYGVEVDGVKDTEWETWHAKWQLLRDAGCFFSAEKFNNTDQTGSISRLNELGDASVNVVRQFAVYCAYVIEQQDQPRLPRAIDTKELPLIIGILNMFERENIALTDDHIKSMAQHFIDLFDCDFGTKGPFWSRVHAAVTNAWRNYNKSQNIPQEHWGKEPADNKNVPVGTNFLWYQLSHSWANQQNIRMPKRPSYAYALGNNDLFS